MERLTHPIRLGICAQPGRHGDAVQYYRGWGPLSELARTDPNLKLIPLDMNSATGWLDAYQVDGVFMTRPWGPSWLEIMNRFQLNCKWVWVDWDDNYFQLPGWLPDELRRQYPPQDVEATVRLAKQAHAVTVSTSTLAGLFNSLDVEAEILPNGINNWWYSRINQKAGNPNALTIYWRGAPGAMKGLDAYLPEMAEVNRVTKGNPAMPSLLWVFHGSMTTELRDRMARYGFDSSQLLFLDWETIPKCFTTTLGVSPDIVIVPHLEHPFNRARSCTAWMEGAMGGGVTLAPNWESWRGLPGCFGYTPKSNPEETCKAFQSNLLALIRLPYSERKSLALKARREIQEHYTWENTNAQRVKLLNRLAVSPVALNCSPGKGMSGYTEARERAPEKGQKDV